MKIYTRTGDDGSTGLIGGKRLSKADLRIETYGTVDELSACLGVAVVSADPGARALLETVQHELFIVGSHLAVEPGSTWAGTLPPMTQAMVSRLEEEIDRVNQTVPPLKQFILPGGTELGARLHLARTICRRAERLLVALSHTGPDAVEPVVGAYMNRLSDWLFVQARGANHRAGVSETAWVK